MGATEQSYLAAAGYAFIGFLGNHIARQIFSQERDRKIASLEAKIEELSNLMKLNFEQIKALGLAETKRVDEQFRYLHETIVELKTKKA